MHALAHPLGALYDAHHGMLNAILMPYVLKANASAIADTMALLARYLDLPKPGVGGVLDWVLALRESIGIPHALSAIGIPDAAVGVVGALAVRDGSAATNPIPFTPKEYDRILRDAIGGTL
jgi:alcohol dehydrogenase class IV